MLFTKFSVLYRSRVFIILLTKACHRPLRWTSRIKTSSNHNYL